MGVSARVVTKARRRSQRTTLVLGDQLGEGHDEARAAEDVGSYSVSAPVLDRAQPRERYVHLRHAGLNGVDALERRDRLGVAARPGVLITE